MGEERGTEFWSTIGGLLRRKRVLIPALLVGLALGVIAYKGTPVSYASSTTMVLTTTEYGGSESQDPTKPPDLTNPMLNFNDSLRTTAGILIEAMNTKGVATQLGVGGPTQLVVNDGRTNPSLLGLNGPFLYIMATSTSPAEAQRVVVEAQKVMRQKLRDWQSALNAPQKTFVSLVDVVPPNTPVPDRGRATKLAVMAFLFGFLLCLGIAYFGYQFRTRRRVRAAVGGPSGDHESLEEDSDEGRVQRRSRAPDVVAADDDDEGDEFEEEDDAGSAVVRTSFESTSGPAAVPTPLRTQTEPTSVPTPVKKAALTVVRVPIKQKVRYRNR